MKKIYFIFSLISFSVISFSQQWSGNDNTNDNIWRNGNVGINATNPTEKLQIHSGKLFLMSLDNTNNSVQPFGIKFATDVSSRAAEILIKRGSSSVQTGLQFNTYDNSTINTMTLFGGKVGIYSTDPVERLQVDRGKIFIRSLDNTNSSVQPYGIKFATDVNDRAAEILIKRGTSSSQTGLQFNTYDNGSISTMTLFGGMVGIGVTPNYKLDVAGTIRACEVKVNLENGCDFVFEQDYNLMSISDLDNFVTENKHLPEIAPAKKMEAEGLNLSEMNIKLLQKIEELTLYTIAQQKEIEVLKKQNAEIELIKKEIELLKASQ